MPEFSEKSLERLRTCDRDLQNLFLEVVKATDCSVQCGYRGEKEQNQAVADGASQTSFPHSRHNSLPSEAVDVYPCPYDWEAGNWKIADVVAEGDLSKLVRMLTNLKSFYHLAGVVKGIMFELGIESIEWGGDWKHFVDLPHWQKKRK